jgi:hypothetical protein
MRFRINRDSSILRATTRLSALLFLGCTIVFAIACSSSSPTPTPESIPLKTPEANPTATPAAVINRTEGQINEIQLNLTANGSPQHGTATFTRLGDGVKLTIRLQPAVRAQIVTLRYGTCTALTGFKDTLKQVIGGYMTQEIHDLGMQELTSTGLTLVVSVDGSNYNSIAGCAELPLVQ